MFEKYLPFFFLIVLTYFFIFATLWVFIKEKPEEDYGGVGTADKVRDQDSVCDNGERFTVGDSMELDQEEEHKINL